MSIAQVLLTRGFHTKLKILCAREIQKSIRDSVHAMLKVCIEMLGMQDHYDVQADGIYGRNGTEFIFKGLRANASEIKSMQGVDICWVEEADKVSAASWKYLIPTIRMDYPDGTCSEIIISFNPELEEDYTYQNFVVDPPASAIVVRMNWRDNPWFPNVLESERSELEAKAQNSKRKMEEYNWIWEGACKAAVEGAIYAEELAIASASGRITDVPLTRGIPVDTYWDLGRSDETAIWFIQRVHGARHVIDFYENSGHHIDHYLKRLQDLADELGYVYGTHHLPHDADHKLVGQTQSVLEQVRAGGRRQARLIARPPRKFLGINAGRTAFATARFDRERCADGLAHARRYRYGVSEKGIKTLDPIHDEHSNAMDAWQTYGLADRPPKAEVKMPPLMPPPMATPSRQGWMR
jgi:phage terminase large subunit